MQPVQSCIIDTSYVHACCIACSTVMKIISQVSVIFLRVDFHY